MLLIRPSCPLEGNRLLLEALSRGRGKSEGRRREREGVRGREEGWRRGVRRGRGKEEGRKGGGGGEREGGRMKEGGGGGGGRVEQGVKGSGLKWKVGGRK